jgi:WD40 repeat protein
MNRREWLCLGSLGWLGLSLPRLRAGELARCSGPTADRTDAPAIDCFGDQLPAKSLARLGTNRMRHPGSVICVWFLPNGQSIISCGGSNSVRIWDRMTGQEARRVDLGGNEGLLTCALSRDAKLLATAASSEHFIKVSEFSSGRQLLAVATDGRRVHAMGISPNNALVAWGGNGRVVHVLDVASGKELYALEKCGGSVMGCVFSPDGKELISCSDGGPIRFSDAKTGRTRVQRDTGAQCLALSADGKTMVTGVGDALSFWDVQSATEVRRVFLPGEVDCLALSPDRKMVAVCLIHGTGKSVLSMSATVRLLAVDTGMEIRRLGGLQGSVYGITFSSNGKMVAFGGSDNTVRVWDPDTGAELTAFASHRGPVRRITFSRDGRKIATGGADGTVRLWNADTGRQLHLFEGHGDTVETVGFTPDGSEVASGAWDGSLMLWNCTSGQRVRQFREAKEGLKAVVFSPDGKDLLACGWTDQVRTWERTTGRVLRDAGPSARTSFAMAIAPQASLVASTSQHGIVLWDARTGQQVQRIETQLDGSFALAFSADSKILASASRDNSSASRDNSVNLWDTTTGKLIQSIEGHKERIWALAFAPNGKILASGGEDHSTRLWDANTGHELSRLDEGQGTIRSLAFSPDGRKLAVGGSDGTVLIWDVKALVE